ncbi:MAG: recombination regulator RecX [Desulfobacula sp.]|uniref:regulatory protein RecX n=1 Tax=Desulfobacula sp. TaxID=2593537 RepID=UPI0025BD4945|nr:regulatory protein RecX [Desulfobacula sp.]MCD4718442.1 recombination regulator RecX [Desulfobacula sp.]
MVNNIKSIKSPLNFAIKYLSYKPRTIHEMQKYIKKKGFSEDIIEKVIATLLEKNYLNDKDFARLFIESKVRNKPKSKFALQYELKKKGISPSIIDAILEQYNDQALALKAVTPKIKMWKNLDDEKFKKKMMNYLRYRGFNYDIFISTLNHFIESKD